MAQATDETLSQDFVPRSFSQGEREQLRQSFAEEGYLVLRDVVAKEKLSELRTRVIDEFERARRSGDLFSGGGLMAGHLNCFPGEGARFAYETLEERGIFDLMAWMFGRPLGSLAVGCNLNLPKSVTQHYHVDSAFKEEFMIVNVAIVDTDLVNGAIDLIPGTNKRFYKFWRFVLERPYRFHKRIPMNQGDVLIRTSNLWHRGMPNHSDVPRPMLAFTFGDKREGPRPADAFQFNEGKVSFHANWFRPDALGRLRERTFVAAPFTYDAYRFVRSLFGDKGYNTY